MSKHLLRKLVSILLAALLICGVALPGAARSVPLGTTATVGEQPQAGITRVPSSTPNYYLGGVDDESDGKYLWSNVTSLVAALSNGETIEITAAPNTGTTINLGSKDNITIIGMGGTNINLSISTSAANLTLQDITMTAGSGPGVLVTGVGQFTLTAEGTVEITGTGQTGSGISSSQRAVEIDGSGSLKVTGGSGSPGIFVSGDLTISAKTTAKGGDSATGDGGIGILSSGAVTINQSAGEVIATGGRATGGTGAGGHGIYAGGNDINIFAKTTAAGGFGADNGGGGIYSQTSAVIIDAAAGEVIAAGGDSSGTGGGGIFAHGDLSISAKTTAKGGNGGSEGGEGIRVSGDIIVSAEVAVDAKGGNGIYKGMDFFLTANTGKISVTADSATLIGSGNESVGKIVVEGGASNITLNHINMTAQSNAGGYGIFYNFAGANTLTIVGAVTVEGNGVDGHGIYAPCTMLEIRGNGSLITNGGTDGDKGGIGIYATGDLIISANTTAAGAGGSVYSGQGIYSGGAITINQASNEVKATAGTVTAGANTSCDGIYATDSITISAKTTATGGDHVGIGNAGVGIWSGGAVTINQSAVEVNATGGSNTSNIGGDGGDGIFVLNGDIAIFAKTTVAGGHGFVGGGNGIYTAAGSISVSGVVTATGGDGINRSLYVDGNAIAVSDNKSVIIEKAGAANAKLILTDGANATKTEIGKISPNLNLTMAAALAGKEQWVVSPASALIGGVKDTSAAVLTTTSTTEIYLDVPSIGGGTGGGTVSQATIPAADGAVKVDYTQSGGTVTLTLPDSKINEIIGKSDDLVVFNLSGVANTTSSTLPKTAMSKFADAELDIEIMLPTGTVKLNREAAASVAAQASGASINVEIKPAANSTLNDTQRAAVNAGDMVIDINIHSGTQNISAFNGVLTVTIPYSDALPVAVWYLSDAGELEKLDCVYDPVTKTVSFTLSHLSLYVIGQDMSVPAWVNPFTDVKEDDWFLSGVKYAHQSGLFSGTSATEFSPNAAMTRGMMVTVLWRLAGSTAASSAGFSDVPADAYYAAAVNWAAANGIVTGIGDNEFAPDINITREQMATMLYRYARFRDIVLPEKRAGGFADAEKISNWAKVAVSVMYAAEVLNGKGASNFDPKGNATRAEVATMFMEFLEVAK